MREKPQTFFTTTNPLCHLAPIFSGTPKKKKIIREETHFAYICTGRKALLVIGKDQSETLEVMWFTVIFWVCVCVSLLIIKKYSMVYKWTTIMSERTLITVKSRIRINTSNLLILIWMFFPASGLPLIGPCHSSALTSQSCSFSACSLSRISKRKNLLVCCNHFC